MPQGLRALVTLAVELGSVPNTYIASHNTLLLQFQRTKAFFWPLWACLLASLGFCILIVHIKSYRKMKCTHIYVK